MLYLDSESSSTSSLLQNKEDSSSCEEPATIAETEPSDQASDNDDTLPDIDRITSGPIEPPPNQLPCCSHSDNTSSRSLRPRRESANVGQRASTTNTNSRKNAPRKAKSNAEQLLQLKKFITSDESD